MIALGLFLVLQQAPPDTLPTCASAALCELVARAAGENRVPGSVASYTARVEVEAAVISVVDRTISGPTAVQQVETDVTWTRAGVVTQHAIGSRNRFSALPLSTLRYLLIGWITPITYGDRFAVFGRQGGTDLDAATTSRVDPDLVYAIHPLASDRERFYRYLSADTVSVAFPDGATREVIRIRVTPRSLPSDRRLLVDGVIALDPTTLATAIIRATLISTGEPFTVPTVLGSVRIPSRYFMELVNTPDSTGVWLPHTQRFEWQGKPHGIAGASPALRITSQFRQRQVVLAATGAGEPFNDQPTFTLSGASKDSLQRYKSWYEPLGHETVQFQESDFFDLNPDRPVLVGKSRVTLLVPTLGENLVRFNRVEGIYVGVPLTYIPGDKRRDTYIHTNVGIATWTGAFKYDASAGWDNGSTRLEAVGGRFLTVTNKFRTQFDSYALGALFSRDNWDYVDRYVAGFRGVQRLGGHHGSRVMIETGYAHDGYEPQVLFTDPWVGYLRPNRGLYGGGYYRLTGLLEINPDISANFVRQGWGFQALYDGGMGDLNYHRIQGMAVGRKDFSRAFIVGVVQAGMTLGDSVPPQQLYEVGGAVGLPGYEYKQYAGNRGILARVRLTVPIALFTLPGAVNKALSVPASVPSISFGYQGAVTSITNSGAQAAVNALGYMFNTSTGMTEVDSVTGVPVPASTASGGWRSSVDVRVGLFGGAFAIGVAKPFVKGEGISVFLSIGGQF